MQCVVGALALLYGCPKSAVGQLPSDNSKCVKTAEEGAGTKPANTSHCRRQPNNQVEKVEEIKMNDMSSTVNDTTTENLDYSQEGEDLAQRVDQLQAQVEKLSKELSLARGTGDVQEQARKAVATTRKPKAAKTEEPPRKRTMTLLEAIEQTLKEKPTSMEQLSRQFHTPLDRVMKAMTGVKDKVHNIGTPERDRWVWKVGDETSTKDLRKLVYAIISYNPVSTLELSKATGARLGRISGCIVDLQRTHKVYNLGSPRRARWFILPEEAKITTVAPQTPHKPTF